MDITTLDKKQLSEAMQKSLIHNRNITSVSNFKRGWEAAIRFAVKFAKADHACTQCGKLITIEETELDVEGVPFCKTCYAKL